MKILYGLFALILITTSCNTAKKIVAQTTKEAGPFSGTYVISQIRGEDALQKGLFITFEGATHKITGFAGCNSFFGTYRLDHEHVLFENIATSKKYCQQDINRLENQLIKALNSTNAISINENVMSFLENETVVLKAHKGEPIQQN